MSAMSKNFISLNKRNGGCPVCGDLKGKCRQVDGLILCMTVHGETPGYSYKGKTSNGLWGIHLPNELAKKKDRPVYHSEPKGNPLSPTERDKAIKSIIQQQPLLTRHKDDLLRRGLEPNQIGEFVSISYGDRLNDPVNPDLAGVNYRGNGFALPPNTSGYIIPVKNIDRLYVGWQSHPDIVIDDAKYIWPKSNANNNRKKEATSHLPSGELPLQHCLSDNPTKIHWCEGIGKPLYAHKRLGIDIIGGSGGRFSSKDIEPKQVLAILERYPNAEHILCPDAGSLLNENVLNGYRELYQLIPQLKVLDYGQGSQDKKIGNDIDEIDHETYNNADIIDFDKWIAKSTLTQWYNLTPDIQLNQQFLSGDVLFECIQSYLQSDKLDNLLLAIKSPLGTAKTSCLPSFFNIIKAHDYFKSILLFSDINRLLEQTSRIFNDNEFTLYFRHDSDFSDIIRDINSSIAACLQSIHLWYVTEFVGRIIIIDEWMSVARAFIDGDTFKTAPTEQTEQLIRAAFSESKMLILLDGNMNDEGVELAQKLSGKRVVKIENQQPNPRVYNLVNYTDRKQLQTNFIDNCLVNRNKIQVLGTDNASMAVETHKMLINLGIPEESILLVYEGSTEKQCPREFKQNPKLFLLKNPQIKIIIYSPSMGRGIDIDGNLIKENIHLFNPNTYYLFDGILSIDQIDQLVFRLRDDQIHRHIFIAEKAKPRQQKNWYTNHLKHRYFTTFDIAKDDLDDVAKVLLDNYKDLIWQAYENNPFRQFEEKWRAIQKIEDNNLRQLTLEFFKAKGFQIQNYITTDDSVKYQDTNQAVKQQIKEEKKAQEDKRVEALVHCPSDFEKLKELQKTDNLDHDYQQYTKDDCNQVARFYDSLPALKDKPELATKENVKSIVNEPQIITKLTTRLLMNNPTLTKKKAGEYVVKMIQKYSDFGSVNLRYFKDDCSKAYLLNKLNLQSFIDKYSLEQFDGSNPDLLALLAKARELRLINKGTTDNVKALQSLLRIIGYSTKSKKNLGNRTYTIAEGTLPKSPEMRAAILESIGENLAKCTGADHTLSLKDNRADLPLKNPATIGITAISEGKIENEQKMPEKDKNVLLSQSDIDTTKAILALDDRDTITQFLQAMRRAGADFWQALLSALTPNERDLCRMSELKPV